MYTGSQALAHDTLHRVSYCQKTAASNDYLLQEFVNKWDDSGVAPLLSPMSDRTCRLADESVKKKENSWEVRLSGVYGSNYTEVVNYSELLQ